MECFGLFIVVLIAIVLLTGVGVRRTPRSSRLFWAYQRLAQRYGGSFQSPGWWGSPSARFTYRAAHVLVRAIANTDRSLGWGPSTQLILPWSELTFRCDIYFPPRGVLPQPADDLQSVAAGPPEFARRFTVRASNPADAAALVNDVIRWQLERLCSTPPANFLAVRIFQGSLTITKGRAILDYPDLLRFVEDALSLYDQALLTHSRGIEFVDQQAAQVLDEVICKVCGEPIVENLVFCRRCRTPHHRDCWQYNGLCSTFACGETEFETPRVAPRQDR